MDTSDDIIEGADCVVSGVTDREDAGGVVTSSDGVMRGAAMTTGADIKTPGAKEMGCDVGCRLGILGTGLSAVGSEETGNGADNADAASIGLASAVVVPETSSSESSSDVSDMVSSGVSGDSGASRGANSAGRVSKSENFTVRATIFILWYLMASQFRCSKPRPHHDVQLLRC